MIFSFVTMKCKILIACFCMMNSVLAITEDDFYQIESTEQIHLPDGDDEVANFTLNPPFPYFGNKYDFIFVSFYNNIF